MRWALGRGGYPAAIDVKDGKILRIRPLHFDEKYTKEELKPWRIEKDGKVLEPYLKSHLAPYMLAYKKRVYSPNRILYPMIREDFDPTGAPGSTGPGGLPHTVGSMLNSVTKFQVISVPFDGEGPGMTALMGGHVDMMPVGSCAATESIKAGRLKALAVIDTEPLPLQGFPNIPPITKEYPEFGKYLPWGPFYGIWVRRDTPEDVKATLTKAFKTAADNAQFQTLMKDRGNVMMNVSGAEADAFLKKWQSVTSWVLQDVGAAKVSPEKFGIPKP